MKKVFHLLSQLGKGLLQCAAIVTLTYIFCRAIPGDGEGKSSHDGQEDQAAGQRV